MKTLLHEDLGEDLQKFSGSSSVALETIDRSLSFRIFSSGH